MNSTVINTKTSNSMFPPFPQEEAYSVCKSMIEQLENKTLVLQQISRVSTERVDHGIMLGVLITKDLDGNKIILETVSGISKKLTAVTQEKNVIFVEPIVSTKKIDDALCQNDLEIHVLTEQINNLKNKRLNSLQEIKFSEPSEIEKQLILKRSTLTTQSLENVYNLYSFHCADKTIRTLKEVCTQNNKGKLPPTGTGDCCAPKLLDYAYSHNLLPVSMCEVFYGKSTNKISGLQYSPCKERCAIVLPSILGLNILYRDNDIIVVNKQSGLLSVPGRGPDKQDCIVNRVRRLFPFCIEQPAVHRLDMETSGILVLAFTKESHRLLNIQFAEKEISKRYVALLDGDLIKKNISTHGQNELFFRLDIDNRPHQIWDTVYGKKAITEWNIDCVQKYTAPDGKRRDVTRVTFIPHTGRTHQLRLASSDPHGFGTPIVGDTLYGNCEPGERLMLHAEYLSFTHPITKEKMEFFCPAEF